MLRLEGSICKDSVLVRSANFRGPAYQVNKMIRMEHSESKRFHDASTLPTNPDGASPESVSTVWYGAQESRTSTYMTLRHTFPSNLVMRGVGIHTASSC